MFQLFGTAKFIFVFFNCIISLHIKAIKGGWSQYVEFNLMVVLAWGMNLTKQPSLSSLFPFNTEISFPLWKPQ